MSKRSAPDSDDGEYPIPPKTKRPTLLLPEPELRPQIQADLVFNYREYLGRMPSWLRTAFLELGNEDPELDCIAWELPLWTLAQRTLNSHEQHFFWLLYFGIKSLAEKWGGRRLCLLLFNITNTSDLGANEHLRVADRLEGIFDEFRGVIWLTGIRELITAMVSILRHRTQLVAIRENLSLSIRYGDPDFTGSWKLLDGPEAQGLGDH